MRVGRQPSRAPWRRPQRRDVAEGASPATAVTFPSTDLVGRVRVALGADLSQPPSSWVWEDISDFVRFQAGIATRQGRPDWTSTGPPSAAQLVLDNRDARFTRRNPTGPYYRLLSKNTPIWAEVDAGSGFKTRLQQFVNEWPKTWPDKSAVDSTVPIQCAGILRRLQQGAVLKSPMLRRMLSPDELTPLAYWPCEEGSTATSVGSAFVGGSPMVGAPTFGGEFGGSRGSLDLLAISDAGLVGTVTLPSASGFQVECMAQCSASNTVILFEVESGTLDFSIALGASRVDGRPHHLSYQCVQNGPNVDITPYTDGVVGATTPVAAVLGSSVQIFTRNFDFFSAAPTSTLAAHVAVYEFAEMTVPTVRASAAAAYAGELATTRIGRICAEEGIAYRASSASTVAMGPQPIAKALDILREAEAADMGTLYEADWGLAYQSTLDRYNAPVGMTVDIDQGQLAEIPTPTDDDQRLRNKWTISRTDGLRYTAELTDGPLGTGAEGPGLYEDSDTPNIESDTQLPGQAGWRLHLSTVDEDRWPDVSISLTRSPALIDTWSALGYGARLAIANPVAQMPPDPPDLIIEGYTEHWNTKDWTATLTCSPASPYRVHVVASTDGNLGRVDAANSTLAADATSGDTTISVASPGALWRTGAVNFDIGVAGERMTVTNIAGGSSPQTFTVTRAVNGITKAQPATVGGIATKVSLWKPGVYAL